MCFFGDPKTTKIPKKSGLGPPRGRFSQRFWRPKSCVVSRLVILSSSEIFDETASFLRNLDFFFTFLGFWGAFRLAFFWGTPEWVKFAVFSILPDPGCPGDPMVGSPSDSLVSWDTLGGIQALGCPQGPPHTGFGVAQDGPVEVLAVLQGKFGWKTVKILQVGFCRTQGARGTPR